MRLLLVGVVTLVADKGEMGEIGDSRASPWSIRPTDKCLSTFSFFFAVVRPSSDTVDINLGRGGNNCEGGSGGVVVNSDRVSLFGESMSVGSSGMLWWDGELGIATCSLDGARNDWFNLGALRLFIKLIALATPLNILVGVLAVGVFGRSSSVACLDSGLRPCVFSE